MSPPSSARSPHILQGLQTPVRLIVMVGYISLARCITCHVSHVTCQPTEYVSSILYSAVLYFVVLKVRLSVILVV